MTNNKSPLVTVIVTSYNHEKFIRKTLNSIFRQKGVIFEVLLADDCSKDSTLAIMKEYVKKYPKIAKILPRKKNLGMCLNMHDAYQHAKGDYIAICEGDDYWIDSFKLKKQSDFLSKNEKYSGTFNAYDCLVGKKLIPHAEAMFPKLK